MYHRVLPDTQMADDLDIGMAVSSSNFEKQIETLKSKYKMVSMEEFDNNLRKKEKMVNVTLCFSAAQALLAAKAGASFISPFVGRLDDKGVSGMKLIEEIVIIYENYGFDTEVLVASVRSVQHVIDAAVIGAHVSTLPPKIIRELYNHDLTDSGLNAFLDDWKKTGQSILPRK